MKTCIYYILFIITLNSRTCFAGQSEPPELTYTNWGTNVHSVSISATLESTQHAVGSAIWIHVRVENQSSNDLQVVESNPRVDFKVTLTSSTGKTYIYHDDKHPLGMINRNYAVNIKSGGHHDSNIAFSVGMDVDVGDCTILVSRYVSTVQDGKFELRSNEIKAVLTR